MQVLRTAEACQRAMEETPDCLLVFSAAWCGPCKKLKPYLEKYAKEAIHVLYVDVDDAPEFASSFNVRSVPTVILRQDGQTTDTLKGCNPAMLWKLVHKALHGPSPVAVDPAAAGHRHPIDVDDHGAPQIPDQAYYQERPQGGASSQDVLHIAAQVQLQRGAQGRVR